MKEEEVEILDSLIETNQFRKEYANNCLEVIKDGIRKEKSFHIGIMGKDDNYEEIIPCNRYLIEYLKCYFVNMVIDYDNKIEKFTKEKEELGEE